MEELIPEPTSTYEEYPTRKQFRAQIISQLIGQVHNTSAPDLVEVARVYEGYVFNG